MVAACALRALAVGFAALAAGGHPAPVRGRWPRQQPWRVACAAESSEAAAAVAFAPDPAQQLWVAVQRVLRKSSKPDDVIYSYAQRNVTDPDFPRGQKKWVANVQLGLEGKPSRAGEPCASKKEAQKSAAAMALADPEIQALLQADGTGKLAKATGKAKGSKGNDAAKAEGNQTASAKDGTVNEAAKTKRTADRRKGRAEKRAAEIAAKAEGATQPQARPAEAEIRNATIDLSMFEIGQSIQGKVNRVSVSNLGVVVDVGAGQEGWLSYQESRDGFPKKLRVGANLTLRVLAKGENRLLLTGRSGDLARSPSRTSPGKTSSGSELLSVSPDEWLDAEVVRMQPQSMLVRVKPPGDAPEIYAKVLTAQLTDAFSEEAVIGGRVKVRVLNVDLVRKTVTLSMKPRELTLSKAADGEPELA